MVMLQNVVLMLKIQIIIFGFIQVVLVDIYYQGVLELGWIFMFIQIMRFYFIMIF